MKTRLLAFLLAGSAILPATAGQLQAGAAKVSITPSPDEFPFPYDKKRGCEPLFTPGKSCNFVDVHDDLYARALVLSDGARTVAIVTVEATAVPDPEALQQKIATVIGIPEADVLLAATHTHEVPLVEYHGGTPDAAQQREINRLEQGAVEAAREAKAHLQDARIAFGRGFGWININNGDSVGINGYNPFGPSDHTLDVIRVTTEDNKPIALLVNYATHAEVMYRSVTKDGGYEVTGDIPGVVSSTLESLPEGAPVVVYTAAAEGDQMSLFKSLQGAVPPLPAKDEGAAGWSLLDEMSRRLTLSVLDVVNGMHVGTDQARIDAVTGSAVCPGQQMHKNETTGVVTTTLTGPVSIPLNVIRINDIALAGVAGDVGSEIGMQVKKESPLADTTLISMTAGSVGYILADDSYARASHGVIESVFRPHCVQAAISQGISGLIKSLPATNE